MNAHFHITKPDLDHTKRVFDLGAQLEDQVIALIKPLKRDASPEVRLAARQAIDRLKASTL